MTSGSQPHETAGSGRPHRDAGPVTTTLSVAIRDYFVSERTELLLISAWSLLLGALAVALLAGSSRLLTALVASLPSGFVQALAVVLLAQGVLGLGSAVPLLARDARHAAALHSRVRLGTAAEVEAARTAELGRMALVLGRYPAYRRGYGVALAVALALVGLGSVGSLSAVGRARALGGALGLVSLAVTGLVIDAGSERRARQYHSVLIQQQTASDAPRQTALARERREPPRWDLPGAAKDRRFNRPQGALASRTTPEPAYPPNV